MASTRRLDVVAGILRDGAGRILITERIGDSPFAGLWEFPGGKIRADESAAAALVRELHEELGIEVRAAVPLMQLNHDYADRRVALEFFTVDEWAGEPRGLDGQKLRWCEVRELDAAELLPADAPVVAALRRDQ